MRTAAALLLLVVCAAAYSQQYQFNVPREMHCTAKPYCGTAGRTCKGVEKTYRGSAAGSARNSIVQECVQANRPDSCNCIQQCRQVAQCSRN